MYIIDIVYKADIAVIDEYLAEHRAYLDMFYTKGLLLCSGPKNPRTGGVIIGLFKTREEVGSFTLGDPYSKHGLITYQITEFKPVKHLDLIKELCI